MAMEAKNFGLIRWCFIRLCQDLVVLFAFNFAFQGYPLDVKW